MFRSKLAKVLSKRVWRISAAHPEGAFVCPTRRHDNDGDASSDPAPDRGCHTSSFELSKGSRVEETDWDALPSEFLEAFSKPG